MTSHFMIEKPYLKNSISSISIVEELVINKYNNMKEMKYPPTLNTQTPNKC